MHCYETTLKEKTNFLISNLRKCATIFREMSRKVLSIGQNFLVSGKLYRKLSLILVIFYATKFLILCSDNSM